MVLQNPQLLRVRLDGDLLARQGAMVAYQGAVTFAFEGGGVGRFLKKALTGYGELLADGILGELSRPQHDVVERMRSVTVRNCRSPWQRREVTSTP